MASCHRGFSGRFFGNELCFPYPFGQVLLFEEDPLLRRLFRAWSLPAVLKVLASAPFEPLHKASLRLLTLKTAFFSGHRLGSQGLFLKGPFYRSRAHTVGRPLGFV